MINDSRTPSPTGLAATRTGAAFWTRLPVGGWQLRFWTDADQSTLIDVVDPQGALACRLSSASQASPSITAGWTWCVPGPDEDRQCWGLAVGHAPVGAGHVVSFARRTPTATRGRMTLPPHAPSGFWVVHNGLWAAAATGCYTHARLTTQFTTRLHPLHPVTEKPASPPCNACRGS